MIYEKCCQPCGVSGTEPAGVMSVIGELVRFDAPSRATTMRPMRVTDTPTMLAGTRASGRSYGAPRLSALD